MTAGEVLGAIAEVLEKRTDRDALVTVCFGNGASWIELRQPGGPNLRIDVRELEPARRS